MSKCTLFVDADFKGKSLTLTSPCPRLAVENFKDKVTSLKVEGEPWVLYQYDQYAGDAWYVAPGNYAQVNDWHGRNDDACSAGPVSALPEVEFFELRNDGGFAIYIEAKYSFGAGIKDSPTHVPDNAYPVGQTHTADIGELMVPEGAVTWILAHVVFGLDHQAEKERFVYRKGCGIVASYTITGVTIDSSLHYNGTRKKS